MVKLKRKAAKGYNSQTKGIVLAYQGESIAAELADKYNNSPIKLDLKKQGVKATSGNWTVSVTHKSPARSPSEQERRDLNLNPRDNTSAANGVYVEAKRRF